MFPRAIKITVAFSVHHFQLLSVPDDHPHLKVLRRLLGDVPLWTSLLWSVLLIDFGPHDDCTLRHLSAWMGQSPVLDWLVLESLEVRAKVAILKIYDSLTDEVVTEQEVVIPELDLQKWAAWEDSLELKLLVNVWACLIFLVVIAFVSNILAKDDLYVRVRGTIVVSSRKVESSDDVGADNASRLSHQ